MARSATYTALFSQVAAVGLVAHPALAQSGGTTANVGIADIVVTATRREESMQKVPIAVTALSTQALAESNIDNVQDIVSLTPGIQVQTAQKPGEAIFQIRGQIQTDTSPSFDPSIGLYFDDVYIARAVGALANLLDVERVEVLKGPQGTLFGKNTPGGAIRIVSNKPTHEFGGYGLASYESFDKYRLEGVLNIPLGDTLAARFAGQYSRKTGGYATNVFTGRKIDHEENLSLRGSAQWELTDKLTILLAGDYSKLNAGGVPTILRHYEPANGPSSAREVALAEGLGTDFSPADLALATQILQGLAAPHGTRTVGSDLRVVGASSYSINPATGQISYVGGRTDPGGSTRTWGGLANISYDMGFATLKSITAYRGVKSDYIYDVDGTVYHLVDAGQLAKNKQFSQEILLNGTALGDRLNWTTGAIYFDEKPYSVDTSVSLAGLSALAGRAGSVAIQDARNKSYGFFAQGTYDLTDALSFTGGLRYTIDKRAFDAQAYNRATSGALACVFTVANGMALLPSFQAPCTISQQITFKKWNYAAALNYQIDADKMIYIRTGRSFRAGGFNARLTAPESVASFKPEVVTDYEFGIKADWLGRTLRTNLAIFHSKTTDVQNTQNGIASNGNTYTLLANIGTRKVNGVELQVVAKPSSFLSYDAGLSYLDAKVNNPLDPQVDYPFAMPKWAWNQGVTISAPLGEDFSARLRGDLSYRGKMFVSGNPLRDPAGNILYRGVFDDLVMINARFTLRHERTGIEFAIYGRNLTNELYANRAFHISGIGIDLGYLAEPRVVGAEMKIPFGSMAR